MSYRTIKRVLGESSLERKCRILFGVSMLVLMLTTYGWYGKTTSGLVNESTRSNCRHLVSSFLQKTHIQHMGTESTELFKAIAEESESVAYGGSYLALESSESPDVVQPTGEWEIGAVERLRERYEREIEAAADRLAAEPTSASDAGIEDETTPGPIYETFKDLAPIEEDVIEGSKYHYVQAVRWTEVCVTCHTALEASSPDEPLPFRAVRITLPYANTQRAINKNYAILLATAIITVFLSMLALYIVVRYVIVKPLQHLQQVSEEVGQGNYEARAHIETNDEFEDLADAYNRMLRHLVSTQTELQDVNTNLDAKVDQLARANMQLYEMNRVKGDFLASVSHELRTPLNSIIGFSDLLGEIESLSDKEKNYAERVAQNGRALLDLINDILDLAKLESGKMHVQPTPFAVEPVIRTQCDLVQKMVEEKNIDLSIHCENAPQEVVQDQSKVQQILTNLLSNAIKFTPEGGRITVTVSGDSLVSEEGSEDDEPCFTMTVEDTGVGIADEDREVIFEKFRQATATRGPDNLTREYSGTGLGLSIVKELCKMLHGGISFESQLGTGSKFSVRLPVHLELKSESTTTEESMSAEEWTNAPGAATVNSPRPAET